LTIIFICCSDAFALESTFIECDFDRKAYMTAKVDENVVFKDIETDVGFDSLKISFKYDGNKMFFMH